METGWGSCRSQHQEVQQVVGGAFPAIQEVQVRPVGSDPERHRLQALERTPTQGQHLGARLEPSEHSD